MVVAEAVLPMMVAHAVFGDKGREEEVVDEVHDDDNLLEIGGVEIIMSTSDSHAHAMYPFYADRPEHEGLSASHIVYEPGWSESGASHAHLSVSHTHASVGYPMFGESPGGLIGSRDSVVAHAAFDAYPVFEESPAGLIKEKDAHLIYDAGHKDPMRTSAHAHTSVGYPVFGESPGGLIGSRDSAIADAAVHAYPFLDESPAGLIKEKDAHLIYEFDAHAGGILGAEERECAGTIDEVNCKHEGMQTAAFPKVVWDTRGPKNSIGHPKNKDWIPAKMAEDEQVSLFLKEFMALPYPKRDKLLYEIWKSAGRSSENFGAPFGICTGCGAEAAFDGNLTNSDVHSLIAAS